MRVTNRLEAAVARASAKLKAYQGLYPRTAMGLTPDIAKTDEWRELRAEYAKAFAEMRAFNSSNRRGGK